jgi:Flp pilus assembly protein TadD
MVWSRRLLPLFALAAVMSPVAAAPPRAQVGDGARVLVMPFSVTVDAGAPGGGGASLWLGEAAALLLGDDLGSFGVRALTRGERVEAFDRLQLPMAASLTRATMIRVAEIIGATEVVHGEIALGDDLRVTARVVQIGAARESPDVAAHGPLAGMFDVFDQVASRLVPTTARARGARPRDPDLPLEVFETYVKGLVAASPAAQRRFLESALTQAPRDGRVLMALWEVYTAADEHDKALAAASAVPAESPRSRRARFAATRSLIELRRYDGAFGAIATLDAEQPDAALVNAQGVIQLRRNATAPAPAAAYFARAVQAEPDNADFLFNLGYAQARAGADADALVSLRSSLRRDAGDGDAHLVLAAVLARTGRPVEARRELELARLSGAVVDPDGDGAPAVVPAGLERLVGQLQPRTDSRPLAALADRDGQATAAYHRDQGRRLFEASRDREAIDELRRAIHLTPYDDVSHLLIGRMHLRNGRLPEAVDELRLAVWARESAPALVALGEALLASGDRAGARRAAARAQTLEPESADVRRLLGRIGGRPVSGPVLPSGDPR